MMKTVILAGGLGTRLSEETSARPKPMVEIGGMPILWHIMKMYGAAGFDEFVLALGYKSDVIKSFFLDYSRFRNNVSVDLRSGAVVEMVRERTTGPDFAILGAFVEEEGGERLVGVTGFRRHENMKERHKSFIWGVFVHPDHRGQGIAGALLDDLIRRHAAQPGIRQIQLQVTEENAGAVGLYTSRGFQVFGREEEALFVEGRYYTDLHMVRRLDMDNAKSAQVE